MASAAGDPLSTNQCGLHHCGPSSGRRRAAFAGLLFSVSFPGARPIVSGLRPPHAVLTRSVAEGQVCTGHRENPREQDRHSAHEPRARQFAEQTVR